MSYNTPEEHTFTMRRYFGNPTHIVCVHVQPQTVFRSNRIVCPILHAHRPIHGGIENLVRGPRVHRLRYAKASLTDRRLGVTDAAKRVKRHAQPWLQHASLDSSKLGLDNWPFFQCGERPVSSCSDFRTQHANAQTYCGHERSRQ